MDGYKHYVRVDSNNIVIKGFTDGFLKEAGGSEEILPGDLLLTGYDGRHFQLKLVTDDERMQFIYKLVNGQMVSRTQEELDVEWNSRPTPPPSEMELLRKENEQLNLSIIEVWENIIPLLPE